MPGPTTIEVAALTLANLAALPRQAMARRAAALATLRASKADCTHLANDTSPTVSCRFRLGQRPAALTLPAWQQATRPRLTGSDPTEVAGSFVCRTWTRFPRDRSLVPWKDARRLKIEALRQGEILNESQQS
jgi:hypothetical protein